MKTTLFCLMAVLAVAPARARGDGAATGATWAAHIDRPGLPNLARVSDRIYRGAQPTAEGIQELKKLGVRTVVNFRKFHSDADLLAGSGIDYFSIPMNTWAPTIDELVTFLEVATDTNRCPVFMHCEHGADRTGLQTAAYRIVVEGWTKEQAIEEMTHGGFGFHTVFQNLIHVIRDLDVEDLRRRLDLARATQGNGAKAKPLRMLCLGDSYTIGESVAEQERWPNQLADLLRGDGYVVSPPQIIAATGWTSSDLHRAMSRAIVEPPYDYVTLLIGVNDQYQGVAAADYLDRFQKVLADAIGLAGDEPRRVIVLSIPDYSLTPFASHMDTDRIRAELERFNVLNREAARVAGVQYINVTDSGREAIVHPDLLAADGLHPSARLYGEWAQQVFDVVNGEQVHK